MKKQKEILPFSLQLVQGAIGKEFVIKHYKYGIIKTKYPDMSGIIPSAKQKLKRNLFAEAVAYAKEIIADKEKKAAWQKRLKKRNSVYNAAIKEYMLREKRKKEKQSEYANDILVTIFKRPELTDIPFETKSLHPVICGFKPSVPLPEKQDIVTGLASSGFS